MESHSAPIDTETALLEIDRQRAWWEGILTDIGEARMDMPGIMGAWTPKDLVAHVNGWQRNTLNELQAAIVGDGAPDTPWPAALNPPEDGDDDPEPINQWIYDQNKDRTSAEVVAKSFSQWDELRSLVQRLSNDQIADSTLFPSLDGESMAAAIESGSLFSHFHEEHEPDIRAWLNDQGDAT